MGDSLAATCDIHDDPYECADVVVIYIDKFQEYGLVIHDGGTSSIGISFCPWCGAKLPDSQRDRWFDEIEALGLDPWSDEIPGRYESDEWLLS